MRIVWKLSRLLCICTCAMLISKAAGSNRCYDRLHVWLGWPSSEYVARVWVIFILSRTDNWRALLWPLYDTQIITAHLWLKSELFCPSRVRFCFEWSSSQLLKPGHTQSVWAHANSSVGLGFRRKCAGRTVGLDAAINKCYLYNRRISSVKTKQNPKTTTEEPHDEKRLKSSRRSRV